MNAQSIITSILQAIGLMLAGFILAILIILCIVAHEFLKQAWRK